MYKGASGSGDGPSGSGDEPSGNGDGQVGVRIRQECMCIIMWLDLLHNEMHDTPVGQRSHLG